jgi:hypothetical protein
MAMSRASPPAAVRRRTAALAWALAALTVLALVAGGRLVALTEAGAPNEQLAVGAVAAVILATVSAAAVGALLASRRPRHPVGWLLLGVGLGLAANVMIEPYVKYGLVVRPGSLPGAEYLVGLTYGSTVAWLSCAGFVLLLTPTGSLPSPRWRWWARLAAAAPVVTLLALLIQPDPLAPDWYGNPLAVPALARVLVVPAVAGVVIVLASLLVGAGSLVGRFRRAQLRERQQLRWLALAAVLGALLLLVALVAGLVFTADGVVLTSLALCVALLPLTTGAAILRYRLYDIDRIVSRTLAYTILSVLLALGYAAVVLGLGRLAGRDSSLVVAAATLAVAAAFQPARRRVQAAVDRRFNRRRHDAGQLIEAFGARLRDQVDLDALHAELLAVVDQTMQPTTAWLWRRPPAAR